MSSLADLTGGPPKRSTRPLTLRGRVVKAPASLADAVFVVFDNYSATREFEVPAGQWMPGTSLPAVGDECVIVFDDDGDAWLVGLATAVLPPGDIKLPALKPGWVNNGGTDRPAHFFKDYLGVVHFAGAVKTTNGTAVDGLTIWQMPTGYRPLTNHWSAAHMVTNAVARLTVDPSGNVNFPSALPAGTIVGILPTFFRTDI